MNLKELTMNEENQKMNDSSSKRKSLMAVMSIICIALIISVAIYVFYLQERKKYTMKEMEAFDVIVDNVSSLGPIDRMEFVICGEITPIEPHEGSDGVVLWIEKIGTPQELMTSNGTSCSVEILIIKQGTTLTYPADKLFDCPDCSGWHHYEIVGGKAIYTYSP